MSTRLNVKVHVKDVNDNPPEFEQENYYLSLEKQPVFGEELLKVKATDDDMVFLPFDNYYYGFDVFCNSQKLTLL